MSKEVKEIKQTTRQKVIKVANVLFVFYLIFFIIATVIFIFLKQTEEKVQESVEPMKDSQVLYLMRDIGKCDIIADIYSVYNDATYNALKNSNNISESLKEKYFLADSYRGNYTEKPYVELSNIRYNPESVGYAEYYGSIAITANNQVSGYYFIAKFSEKRLIDLTIIP